MAELDIGNELSVHEERSPDPRSEREHDDQAFAAPAGPEADFGEPREIGVISDDERRPVASFSISSARTPIHFFETLAAVWMTPPRTTPGKPQPTGPSYWNSRIAVWITPMTLFGVEGEGVG
jgi:hypothetical protein